MAEPTIEEKYQHMRENAEAFIHSMRAMVDIKEREGNLEMATSLRVWCLNPWEAAIRDDDSGDLWPTCEVCGNPIKDEAQRVCDNEGIEFHRNCVED